LLKARDRAGISNQEPALVFNGEGGLRSGT
jgi:hypothetical protein